MNGAHTCIRYTVYSWKLGTTIEVSFASAATCGMVLGVVPFMQIGGTPS